MQFGEGQVLLTSKTKFAQLIPANTDLVFMTAYCLDPEWLESQLEVVADSVPVWLCVPHDSSSTTRRFFGKHPLHLITPHFPRYTFHGIMHSKLIIYRTSKFTRIIISSANLCPYDYDDGPIQNILYVQDYRALGAGEVGRRPHFLDDLTAFLGHLQASAFTAHILHYDYYSQTDHVRLVYSTPGNHQITYGEGCCGMEMLGRACSQLRGSVGTSSNGEPNVTVQGSSLGKMTKEWLWHFYSQVTTGAAKSNTTTTTTTNGNPKLQIVFPTESYALAYGKEYFSTIFCQPENWPHYDHSLFYQCAALSPLHSKIVLVDSKPRLVYLGSHNFTAAAWGRYTASMDKLRVNNYELGVVIRDRPVPLPFKYPPSPYSPGDRPWMQNLHL
jgi:tyrosyl-DNA phosphodiesterase-1